MPKAKISGLATKPIGLIALLLIVSVTSPPARYAPADSKNHCDENCLFSCNRSRTNRCSHRI